MKQHILTNNGTFYGLCFIVWTGGMYLMHGNYRYFDSPLRSVINQAAIDKEFSKKKLIANTLKELYASLQDEERPRERGHIFQNIGCSYYDLHKVVRSRAILDSARIYYLKAINVIPDNSRFHYNAGRLFTEYRNHAAAKKYYERAIALKPDYILAMHNLALLNYFELGNRDTAISLFNTMLKIQPNSPVCNYVLGTIAEKDRDYTSAVSYYNREIEVYYAFLRNKIDIPIARVTLQYTLAQSHLQLARLYASKKRDRVLASKNLEAYFKMEQDSQAREAVMKEFHIAPRKK